jgi:hypothetical protein
MAVFQGTRLPAASLPVRSATLAHRGPRLVGRAAGGVRPAGIVMGIILVGTLLALVYLTQTLRAAATNVEITRLMAERSQLHRDLQSQAAEILRWTSRPAVTQWAQHSGLDALGNPLIISEG